MISNPPDYEGISFTYLHRFSGNRLDSRCDGYDLCCKLPYQGGTGLSSGIRTTVAGRNRNRGLVWFVCCWTIVGLPLVAGVTSINYASPTMVRIAERKDREQS